MAPRERIMPGPGQESVGDYPRPPHLEEMSHPIQVILNGATIAEMRRAWRILETSNSPVYSIPPDDLVAGHVIPTPGSSFCEWKGSAS